MVGRNRREYRLTLYPSQGKTEWRLVRVDWRSGTPSYSRVDGGSLPLAVRGGKGFLLDLQRIIRDLEKRWQVAPVPEGPREPLGGGGGDQPLPGMEWIAEVISQGGQPLDNEPEEL